MLQLKDKPQDERAWARFIEMGLPGKKDEVFRYVRLKELYDTPFCLPKGKSPEIHVHDSHLVFVNGLFSPQLSSVPKPLVALPLSEAMQVYGNFLKPRIQKQLKEEKNPFALLNQAYSQEGLFLYIPPKTSCETPLKIVHLIDKEISQPTLISPRIHIFGGKHSTINIEYYQKIQTSSIWVNGVLDLVLDEGAQLSFSTLFHQQVLAHNFLTFRATLKQRALLNSYEITNGATTSRHDYSVHLQGLDASASLYGAWKLNEQNQHHVNVLMDHSEPSCHSLQQFKGVLAGNSRSSFEGKIHVCKEAQKTEAYQMNNNLLLSQRASANVKPNLEIFADDVKASHGATVGQLDDEQLFYLMTRGCSKDLAKNLLIKAFTQEIICLLKTPESRKAALEVFS